MGVIRSQEVSLGGATSGVLEEYLGRYGGLIGDKRTGVTFSEIVRGIIGAGSLWSVSGLQRSRQFSLPFRMAVSG